MGNRPKWLLGVVASFLLTAGCIGGGPHLSVERGEGSPTGGPSGEPEALPPLTKNWGGMGVGSGASRSENFRAFSGTTFVFGGRSRGEIYTSISPEMSAAKRNGESTP